MSLTDNAIINWFIPRCDLLHRSDRDLARIFVFTHLAGPLLAGPMIVYLAWISPAIDVPFLVIVGGTLLIWSLPFLLRRTESIPICAFVSFQALTMISLCGILFYGGMSSPFLPWLVVSLMLALFYLSKRVALVLGVFAADLIVFTGALLFTDFRQAVSIADLQPIGWLSLCASAIYVCWMVLYYARVVATGSELHLESERYRETLAAAENARSVADAVSRHRGRFFAKMSHELRTPLNVIIGYSEILLEDIEMDGDGRKDQSSDDLHKIKASANHLLSLVSHVLEPDEIENDMHRIAPSQFTLACLRDDVVANAEPLIARNGNRLDVVCLEERQIVYTDRKMVRQMVINLLSNAGKFTENGKVGLQIGVGRRNGRSMLTVIVTDTGIGIAPQALEALFQDYVQADGTISNRFGGTGIGLSLSRRQAILLGGDITVTSQLQIGSEFTIEIPATYEVDDEAAADGASKAGETMKTDFNDRPATQAA